MALKTWTDTTGTPRARLTACPVCGADLNDGHTWITADHFREAHGPEDFGLSPIGEVSA